MTASRGFDAALFEELRAFEESSFWFRARNRLIVWAVREFHPGARNLLEVGCGTGFVLRALHDAFPQLALTGAEPFEEGLDVAAERVPAATLLQADARTLPFDDAFDVVGSFDVLEHIADDEAALASMFTATRRGGTLLVTVPQHPWLWSAFDELSHHERRYTRAELVSKVEHAGFTVRRVTSFVSLLLPALAAARARRKRAASLAAQRLDPRLDRLLERVMDGERALIRSGLSLPAGGSLLLVAHRRR